MRQQLQPFLGGKFLFSATVGKFGLRHMPYRGSEPTMMLKDLALHSGTVIVPVDHLWAYV